MGTFFSSAEKAEANKEEEARKSALLAVPAVEAGKPIRVREVLSGAAAQPFVQALSQHGFAVLELDEEFRGKFARYMAQGRKFLGGQSLEAKQKQCEVQTADPLLRELGHNPNEGFLRRQPDGDPKEYLKLKRGTRMPDEKKLPGFSEDFDGLFGDCFDLAMTCLRHCARVKVVEVGADGARRGEEQQYVPDKMVDDIQKHLEKNSSLSIIRYIKDDGGEKEQEEEDEGGGGGGGEGDQEEKEPQEKKREEEEKDGEELDHVPCGVHTDTGVLTFIIRSAVPGLECLKRERGKENLYNDLEALAKQPHEYVNVEKEKEEGLHLFVIAGRKLGMLGEADGIFPPTVHRVKIAKDVERYSLLFFFDA